MCILSETLADCDQECSSTRAVFHQPKRAHVTRLLINRHRYQYQIQVTNACLQSDFWVCNQQLKLNHTDVCSFFLATLSLQETSSGLAIPATMAITVLTAFIFVSSGVERAAKCCQSRGILYLQEPLEHS